MNPNHTSEQPGLNLPPPAVGTEATLNQDLTRRPLTQTPEFLKASPQIPQILPTAPYPQPSLSTTASPHTMPINPVNDDTSLNPLSAQDGDRIEKIWVVKAKRIIQETKEDPNSQTKQLGRIKAEYIKKRFNRDLITKE